ncbi:C-GCAxxG-C-C family protein [Amedibacterium intestinale]|uniref:C-GCAxxG-C-C family protein n=1 Tax=Amedibacterium intestinale TaxID=2583452 RepID=UPI000E53917D|nr:C-GCAxxG-C-C family protein [Amedibacterium intestinale]RHO30092.1 C_GCAxxG_C_C family protein [Erysipelotrichaceae bacterium AM17-60]
MLKDVAVKYYRNGYNCAESILQAGDICGALSGAACVISSRYVETKAHDYKDMREITQKLVSAFQERMGSRLCSQIKPVFHTKETKCENTVAISAEVLEQVIQEWDEAQKQRS